MHLFRPAFAVRPSSFGRGPLRSSERVGGNGATLSDLRLFAATFIAGFLFISILIG